MQIMYDMSKYICHIINILYKIIITILFIHIKVMHNVHLNSRFL